LQKVETMTFNVLVAEPDNEYWASIAEGIRRQGSDASILRVKDGDQAVRFLFQRGLLTEQPQIPDLVVLAKDLPIVPSSEIVALLRQNAGTRTTPIVVVWPDMKESDIDAGPDSQQWFSRQHSLVIVGTVSLEREVAKAVHRLRCDSHRGAVEPVEPTATRL
jgi:CheY-like chemotaxis protein